MKRKRTAAALLLAGVLLVSGCAANDPPIKGGQNMPSQTPAGAYQKITAEEARRMMGETGELILLDVRTQEEFDEKHIEGAVLLPDFQVRDKAGDQLPDKDAVILVYCRSGRRSAGAAQQLADMGYTHVYDFGGIIDWPYATVSGGAGAE